ncbi:hypothetical protein DXG03_005723 [Asterophora parasitica]|uniref:Uncharacterized protein n=1 Tax=Asterophora parasitica TaxID=117018 RepID=A0A9P7KE68_9AGAR|nr:hypothetical protein DXG03_005723 [Asterophora parasitica]
MVTSVKAMTPTARITFPIANQNSDSGVVCYKSIPSDKRRDAGKHTSIPPDSKHVQKPSQCLSKILLGLLKESRHSRICGQYKEYHRHDRYFVCPKLEHEIKRNDFERDQSRL